ncbi:hypothetical protein M0813_29074 [Anaeramoeba flamelloides]|uniref:Autophagy-related protein 27 n=1 Tax=Anaeramoeba flamelloides TaxID=1746091 RepID=A0ABQ8XS54_9EUKA|nr:hypothetical protein M0813_29074 [Anaeramoeba flamelloides]
MKVLLLISFCLFLSSVFCIECKFNEYDFTKLDKNLFTIKEPIGDTGYNYIYYEKICSKIDGGIDKDVCGCCQTTYESGDVVSIQLDESHGGGTGYCRNIGANEHNNFKYIDSSDHSKGVYILHDGGVYGKQTRLFIKCNKDYPDGKITNVVQYKDGVTQYNITLEASDACSSDDKKDTGSKGLSGGAIFLIIFFSGVGAYFIFGMLINKVARKKEGSEIIPNSSFWKSWPGLMADGARLLMCKKSSKNSYESF